jgi:hypothetical protein
MTMGYKLIGYKEPDPLFEFFTIEDYEKFAEDPDKDLTEGLIPVYVGTFDSLTPEEFNQLKEGSTSVGHAITTTEAMLKEKNSVSTRECIYKKRQF